MLGRLHATRGFSAFVFLLLVSPVLVALTLRQAAIRTALPDLGMDVNADLGVEARDGRWVGVHQRDRIVALDGAAIHSPTEWVERALAGGNRELAVTFERDGRTFVVTAASRSLATLDRIAVFARILTAAVLMALGFAVFVARPGAAVTWLLLVLSWDLGAFLLIKIGLWWDPRLVKEATVFPWTIATSVGLHLLCFFPQRIQWFVDRPWRVALLYGPLALAPVIQAFHLVTRASAIGTAVTAIAMVGVVAVIVAQFRKFSRTNDARVRSQYRALIVGFALGLLVPAVWNYLRISLDIWNSPWAAHYNALPLVLFVGVTSFSVVRHNALEIDRFTAAVVGYGVTTILVGTALVAALIGVPLVLGTRGFDEASGVAVATTALTFAGVAPVYRLIRRWVDRRFFREQAGANDMADALLELVVAMQGSRDDAVTAALAAAQIFRSDRVEVWFIAGDADELRLERRVGLGAASPAPVLLDGALGQALASGASGGVLELAPRTLETGAQDELWSHELAMISPVIARGDVAGFVALGRKRSGAGYQPEELSLLTIIGAQLAAAVDRARGDDQIGRYHLERRIGTGGMAEVYLASQAGPGGFERRVALKRPLPHVSEDSNAVAAFLDEARLAAQLVHPHIAAVYDVGEDNGSYFIVMEYVDGLSLRQFRQRAIITPVPIACALVIQVLAALDYAHRARDDRDRPLGLVHRDVSPRNILLNRQGQPKLVDFGIARAEFQLHVTRTGIVKGTLPYMAPEQASGLAVDHRADLYSAAVVLYELLTGEVAYPDGPAAGRARPASAIVVGIPARLDRVIERATAAAVDDRFATAGELAAAIAEAILPLEPAPVETVVAFLHRVAPALMERERHDPGASTSNPTAAEPERDAATVSNRRRT